MDIPSGLKSRDNWADFFEKRMPSEPHLHQIEPTNHCPYTCIMCPRGDKMIRSKGFMDFSLFKKVIDEVVTYSPQVKNNEIELFHFGESLLHPMISEMTGYASDKGLKITLSVNPPQLEPELAKSILENRPYKIILSLDGYDQETYGMIRGNTADFSKAIENINALSKLINKKNTSTKVCIRMIQLKKNRPGLDAFKRKWEQRGIAVELRPFFPWSEQSLTDLGEFRTYPPFMPCPFPWQHAIVQWDGTVVPCCRDYNSVNKMGNLNKQSLKEIWDSPSYANLREQHRTGDYKDNRFCRQCMALYYTEEISNSRQHDRKYYAAAFSSDISSSLFDKTSPITPSSYLLICPGCEIDMEKGTVVVNSNSASQDRKNFHLNPDERVILYWAARLKTVHDISRFMNLDDDNQFINIVSSLRQKGVLQAADISFDEASEYIFQSTGNKPETSRDMSLSTLWQKAVQPFSEKTYLIWPEDDSRFTYGDSDIIISKTAAFLSSQGLLKGDRLLVLAVSTPEFAFLFWAAMRLGMVIIPVDTRTGYQTLKKIIKETNPRFVVADSTSRIQEIEKIGLPVIMFDIDENVGSNIPLFSSSISDVDPLTSFPETTGDDDAIIIYTSGTTGSNNGVILSQGALFRTAQSLSSVYHFTDNAILLCTADFHVISGPRSTCVVPVHTGASMVLPSMTDKSSPMNTIALCARYCVSSLLTVPAFLTYCVTAYEKIAGHLDLGRLKTVLCTGTTLHESYKQQFMDLYKIDVYNFYGLTETCGGCIFIIPGSPECGINCIGKPFQAITAIPSNNGNIQSTGSAGELLICTDSIMKGYAVKQNDTSERMLRGWFHTGDIVYYDENNNIIFQGRKGDLIIDKNGDNIFPDEIENIILLSDDIDEAGVIGFEDEHLNEKIAAFIVLSEKADTDHQAIINKANMLIEKHLSAHKVPSRYIVIDKLPKAENGKILKRELLKQITES